MSAIDPNTNGTHPVVRGASKERVPLLQPAPSSSDFAVDLVKAADKPSDWIKWTSLGLLVLQNSSLFLVTRYTRAPSTNEGHRMYLASVVVLVVELVKMLTCLLLLLRSSGGLGACGRLLWDEVWVDREITLRLGVPSLCYTIQNNLIFLAVSNLSAAAAQVLYQSKTLSTALFSVLLLGRSFLPIQWLSFGLLGLGVVMVQSQDQASAAAPTGASPALGLAAALVAATLSGFAGVYLEKMFTTGASSLWMRNVQLSLFAVPLQLAAIAHADGAAVREHGLMQGWLPSTWAVVFVQAAGGLIAAVVIKHAGNILKTFATVVALLCTCAVSLLVFDFTPTPLFGAGVAVTAASIWMYAKPSLDAAREQSRAEAEERER